MPVRRFWFMQRQIDRIEAARLLDSVPLVQCSMGGEAVKEYVESLKQRMGKVLDIRPIQNVKTEESEKQKLKQLLSQ